MFPGHDVFGKGFEIVWAFCGREAHARVGDVPGNQFGKLVPQFLLYRGDQWWIFLGFVGTDARLMELALREA